MVGVGKRGEIERCRREEGGMRAQCSAAKVREELVTECKSACRGRVRSPKRHVV